MDTSPDPFASMVTASSSNQRPVPQSQEVQDPMGRQQQSNSALPGGPPSVGSSTGSPLGAPSECSADQTKAKENAAKNSAWLKYCLAYLPKLRVFCQQQEGKISPAKLGKIKNMLDTLEGRIRLPEHYMSRCKEYLDNTFPDVHANKTIPEPTEACPSGQRADQTGPERSRKDISAALETYYSEATLDYRSAVSRSQWPSHLSRLGIELRSCDRCSVNAPCAFPSSALNPPASRRQGTSVDIRSLQDDIAWLKPSLFKAEIVESPNVLCNPYTTVRFTPVHFSVSNWAPSLMVKVWATNPPSCSCLDDLGNPEFDGDVSSHQGFVKQFIMELLKTPYWQTLNLDIISKALKQSCIDYKSAIQPLQGIRNESGGS